MERSPDLHITIKKKALPPKRKSFFIPVTAEYLLFTKFIFSQSTANEKNNHKYQV
jgi:hypothetical protein